MNKKTFKVGDKVRVTRDGMMGTTITYDGVIVKLNSRYVYVCENRTDTTYRCGYERVEKI